MLPPRTLLFVIVVLHAPLRSQVETPDWSVYHDSAQAHAMLRSWATAFPDLTRLHTLGKTLEGTPLLLLEITNKKTGEASDKPAYYYDGNIHSEELTSAEVALYFAWTVLSKHGQDPRITALLDTQVLYVRPKFNPDGADVTLKTIHNPRSTPRPWDEDGDGRKDEDPPNDLDGDGFATRMRVQNPHGAWRISREDDRLMVRRDGEDPGPFYDVYSEGTDDDGDGAFNEDDVGGIDMNRNFPRNWGMPFEQRGAGPFPLSEPETRATVEFLDTHRHVCGLFHGHTSGGFLFRLPSTTSWDDFPVKDQRLIRALAAPYRKTTGQRIVPSFSNPRAHRHGTLISWAYWDYGVVGFVPEFWGGAGVDEDDDGDVSELERLNWSDRVLEGRGFARWRTMQHPQLGDVEVGGWRRRFTTRNPPPALLEAEIRMYLPWMLWLAEQSPRLTITHAVAESVPGSEFQRVRVEVRNVGVLPTNLTQRAIDNETAVPVRASIELEDASLVMGAQRRELGHLKGRRDAAGAAGPGESGATVEWLVRKAGSSPTARITITSQKAGTLRRVMALR